jgi:hypothetical protein
MEALKQVPLSGVSCFPGEEKSSARPEQQRAAAALYLSLSCSILIDLQ